MADSSCIQHSYCCLLDEGRVAKLEMKEHIAKKEKLKQFFDNTENNRTNESKPPTSLGYGLFNEFRLNYTYQNRVIFAALPGVRQII